MQPSRAARHSCNYSRANASWDTDAKRICEFDRACKWMAALFVLTALLVTAMDVISCI